MTTPTAQDLLDQFQHTASNTGGDLQDALDLAVHDTMSDDALGHLSSTHTDAEFDTAVDGVLDDAEQAAARINNDGPLTQIEHLLTRMPADEVLTTITTALAR